MIKLTKTTEAAILAHATAAHPQEACGFILAVGRKQVYQRCRNVAADPEATFEIAAEDWIAAAEQGEVIAVVHSHPQGELYLSGADRQAQRQSNLPWVLVVSGSLKVFAPVLHLRGRVFEYGKADCFTLLRDAYHLAGIELPDPVRGDMDEDAAKNRFIEEGVPNGFSRVFEPQPGDVILTALGGNANHAALYLGNNEILHHAHNHLSRREPYRDFWVTHTHSMWRHKDWQPEMLQAVLNDLGHAE